jgi:acyl-CoA thioesterase-1
MSNFSQNRINCLCIRVLLFLVTSLTVNAQSHTLVFFGDSLTAGYGLESPDSESYPALIQDKITQEKLPWRVVNAGLSGDTTSGGLTRINWILRQPFDIIFIELGANDGLRGIATEVMASNLHTIIARIRTQQPHAIILLAGMQMPMNYGEPYRKACSDVFSSVARTEKVYFEPFLLEGVGGVPELNQADGIHPNVDGAKLVAEGVWKLVHPILINYDLTQK